jgi:hypothetical protein
MLGYGMPLTFFDKSREKEAIHNPQVVARHRPARSSLADHRPPRRTACGERDGHNRDENAVHRRER